MDPSKNMFAFISKLNHDLRTPLTAMLNMIGLIKDDPQRYCTADNLNLVQEAGLELRSLLQDITDLAKLESGNLKLKIKPVDVRDLLNDTISAFAEEAGRKNLVLDLVVDRQVPNRISADGQRLQQILSHLISNALKYTEQGTVILRAVCSKQGDKLRLVFSVEDTGDGISEEAQNNLFDRFLHPQGDSLVKNTGSGLGLAVSKRLVQSMGGDLNVSSEVGKGSNFSFDLPCREYAPEAGKPLPQTDTQVSLSDLGRLRVLVVEDNFINLLSFSQMLEQHGFDIQGASNGKQALDYLQQQSFDIVLMDVKMPIMDGLETTRRLRSSPDPRLNRTKVIALTAYSMPEDRQRIMAAGMDDIVSKPIEMEELTRVLRRVLGGR